MLEIENHKNQGLLNRFVNNEYLITELSRVFEMSLNLLWPYNTVSQRILSQREKIGVNFIYVLQESM